MLSSMHIGLSHSEVDVSLMKPELNEVEGVFQLGPADRCKDIFVLSMTVAFAGNLASVSLTYSYMLCDSAVDDAIDILCFSSYQVLELSRLIPRDFISSTHYSTMMSSQRNFSTFWTLSLLPREHQSGSRPVWMYYGTI